MAGRDQKLLHKFQGCLMGAALGDAIGELAFMAPAADRLQRIIPEKMLLRYTDDTAMTIGLTESLLAQGTVDLEHLGRTFHRHYQHEPWRGYASGPPTVFHLVETLGISYAEAATRLFGGQGSLGNGAAMRVAPVGLFFHDSPELYDMAVLSAMVTHAHPLAQDGAAVQAAAVAQAVKLEPHRPLERHAFLEGLLSVAKTRELQEKLQLVGTLLRQEVSDQKAAGVLGRSVKIHESLPYAIFCFLAHHQSYTECLWAAVLQGGDRDTLGAMAGALGGAYLGLTAIPENWLERLENREILANLAQELLIRVTDLSPSPTPRPPIP